jgi:hypothetical protein
VCVWGGGGRCLLANFDRPFFHKNDTLEQNRIAGSERVRRNSKYTNRKRSAGLVAKSFEG